MVTEAAMTALETPQARPRAVFEGTKTLWRMVSCMFCLRKHRDLLGHVLVFTEQRQVKQDLDGLSVGCHNNEFAYASVQRLGRFVGALLELFVV